MAAIASQPGSTDPNPTESWDSTEPGILVSAMAEEAPTLTAAAIVGVTLVVVFAIAIVFVFGVLIDCRQQRRLEQKKEEQKRPKTLRRASAHPGDATSIVDNMEEPALSEPPAMVVLRDLP